jgi:outer membrane protein assembly factor BamB
MTSRLRGGVTLAALVAFAAIAPGRAPAQFEKIRRIFAPKAVPETKPAEPGRPKGSPGGMVIAEDRERSRNLDLARSHLQMKRYAAVAQHVGALLENSSAEDFFLPPDPKTYVRPSFKTALRQMLATLPPDGREAYERQFGPKAQRLLHAALQDGGDGGLELVAGRYPHTQAGYQATFLLSQLRIDQGRPDEALKWLEQLRESPEAAKSFEPVASLTEAIAWSHAGQGERALQTLLALKKQYPQASFEIGGKTRYLFANDAQALAWLAELAPAPAAPPTVQAVARGVPLMRSPGAELTVSNRSEGNAEAVEQERQLIQARKETPLPMLHPVAVGDVVLMRTPGGVKAVSVKSGQFLWRYPPESRAQMSEMRFDQLIWREAAFGRVSTDGRLAFLIEGAYAIPGDPTTQAAQVMFFRGPFFGGMPGGGFFMPGMGGGGSSHLDATNRNQLTAIDVPGQGKLRWSVGGDTGGDEPRLAGAFFLGPPTATGQQLFVLAELKSAIHLAVLDKRTGRLAWMQKLADVEHSIAHDPFRRMAGASPVVVSGIAVCPTSCGGVVAVDTARHALLWVYQHPRKDTTLFNPDQGRMPQLAQGGRWAEASLIVAEGRVLLTPAESDEMHCLELRTGRRHWTTPRNASLYVACVHNGKVVLVDNRFLHARKLSDGTLAWPRSVPLPGSSRPSGRGVHSGDFYYLPLTDPAGGYSRAGQIAQVDLDKGAIVDRVASQREFVPGNLIYHNGRFVSQGVQYLEIFDELAKLESQVQDQLKSDPRDAAAWARLADIKRHRGKLPEAIDHLRHAYGLKPDDTLRGAYAAILLDGITAKLPNQVELLAELEKMAR